MITQEIVNAEKNIDEFNEQNKDFSEHIDEL